MKKRVTLKELRVIVRRIVESQLDDELERVEVGDLVDVDVDEIGTLPVRVISMVDDVNKEAGPPDPRNPEAFTGPGFVGEIDPSSGESGTMVFSLNQVMPGSKMKGYFPKLGDEFDEDEYGRPMNNPYRKGARRHAVASISRVGDYLPEADKDEEHPDPTGKDWDSGLDESEKDHEGDPRWDNHADPTGKAWDAGLDEGAYEQDIDDVMGGLQTSLKALEDAHPQAPDDESKAIVAGLHSDLFNAQAQARPYIRTLKAKAKR